MKLKEWMCNGNDCSKCKWCWEVKTSYEYDEWDCGCYIKGDDFDDKACHLINPFKFFMGIMAKRKANYHFAHEYDGFADFMMEQKEKDDKLEELFMKEILEGYLICWRDKDGMLHECNSSYVIHENIWNVRSKYEDFTRPVQSLSEEWKNVISKTLKRFYHKTLWKIVPYIRG